MNKLFKYLYVSLIAFLFLNSVGLIIFGVASFIYLSLPPFDVSFVLFLERVAICASLFFGLIFWIDNNDAF